MDPARLYRQLLLQLPPTPTALLVMPGSSDTDQTGVRPSPADQAAAYEPDQGLRQEERAVISSVTSLGVGEAPVDLVGFSGGATSALAYATAHPGRVRRLVLIEPSWLGNHLPGPEEAAYLSELDAVMRLPDTHLGPAFIRHFSPYRHAAAAPPIPSPQLARAAAGMRRVWRRWRHTDIEPDLGALPTPLLICAGERSHPRMARAARSIADRAPRGVSCITAEHDHFTITVGVTLQVAGFLADPSPPHRTTLQEPPPPRREGRSRAR